LYALDVAAVVGPPYVDQGRETTVHLGLVVGDVGGKIGIAAVRLHQRSIDIVTEVGRAKQRLLSVLPILYRRALGRRQPSLVDIAGTPQGGDGLAHVIA